MTHMIAQEIMVMRAVKAAWLSNLPSRRERRDDMVGYYGYALELETAAALSARLTHNIRLSQRQVRATRDPATRMRANHWLLTRVRCVPTAKPAVVGERHKLVELLRCELGDIVQL